MMTKGCLGMDEATCSTCGRRTEKERTRCEKVLVTSVLEGRVICCLAVTENEAKQKSVLYWIIHTNDLSVENSSLNDHPMQLRFR